MEFINKKCIKEYDKLLDKKNKLTKALKKLYSKRNAIFDSLRKIGYTDINVITNTDVFKKEDKPKIFKFSDVVTKYFSDCEKSLYILHSYIGLYNMKLDEVKKEILYFEDKFTFKSENNELVK